MNELSQPKVSFVIPARNEERFIGDCIDSLQAQTVDFLVEIIVVDNGSTDATAVTATRHGARVVFEAQAGLANARQAGLEAARGEYLIYVDADSRLPEHWTREVIGRFEREARLVAVSPEFTFYDGRAIDNVGNLIFREILVPATNAVLRLCGRAEILIGSAIALRTAALKKVGGVDLGFPFYGEDTMLACRIHAQGNVRFLRRPTYQTSARRYQQSGLLDVVYRYFSIFALIQLGRVESASELAKEFRDQDQLRSRERSRPATPSALAPGRQAGEFPLGVEDLSPELTTFSPEGQAAPL